MLSTIPTVQCMYRIKLVLMYNHIFPSHWHAPLASVAVYSRLGGKTGFYRSYHQKKHSWAIKAFLFGHFLHIPSFDAVFTQEEFYPWNEKTKVQEFVTVASGRTLCLNSGGCCSLLQEDSHWLSVRSVYLNPSLHHGNCIPESELTTWHAYTKLKACSINALQPTTRQLDNLGILFNVMF